MPATAAALAEGAVSLEHAVVIAKTMRRIPKDVSVEDAARAEVDLAGFARRYDPLILAKLADHLLFVLEADSAEGEERRRYERRELRLNERTGRISGQLDPTGMATVRTALDALARPQPGPDGSADPRTAGQRLSDALVELARRAMARGDLPAQHGTAPHVLLIAGLDTLTHPHTCPDTTANDPDQNPDDATADSPDAATSPDTADSDTGQSDSGEAGGSEGGDPGTGAATGDCPLRRFTSPGDPPPGELLWGGPVSAATVRVLTCDAGIRRVVVDPAGAVLDVGREYRTVTPDQYAALIARDGGCAFPGCTRPASWCIAHHIIHWADGGTTALDNLVLLCTYHHTTVHHRGWNVRIATDRLPEFIPPPWVDPDQTPTRNTQPRYHRKRPPPDT